MRFRSPSQAGSVLLVALCFVTVLGISLAGYIAVCSRAMSLSNRNAQTALSQQLADMGLEEGLRAFNKNDFSDWSNGPAADWTVSGTTATCNLTFPAGTFGQGVTGSVKIRVDNYNANQLDATWSSTTPYRINDLVGSNGIWYRSVRNNNTNQAPSATNLTWWVTNPMPWTWRTSSSYSQYDMVNYKGIWYRCITAHTSHATTFSSDSYAWVAIPTQRAWASSTAYSIYDVVSYTDPTSGDVSLYRCTTAHTSSASFGSDTANWTSNVQTVSLAWSPGTVYTRGSIVYYTNFSTIYAWFYCRQSGTSSTAPSADTTMWTPIWIDAYTPTGPSAPTAPTASTTPAAPGDTVVVGAKYYVGGYINYGGTWYRCTTAHTYVDWATSSGNWTSTYALPYLSLFFRGLTVNNTSNNIFYYAGSNWYRHMGGWNLALTGNMHARTSGYKYNPGDAVYYTAMSRWYRCILAHTASGTITPTNTTYWATAPLYSNAWDSGRQYGLNDTVRYNGVRYLSLQNGNSGRNPATATTWWIGANTGTASYQWIATTAYAAGDYKCYGGVWYKCLSANTGKSPNNTTYWTASWTNSWGVTTGAPVVYAEGTVNIVGSPSIRTQLRATIAPAPLFPNAAASATTISASSGGTVDSYDSTQGTIAVQGGGTSIGGVSNYGTYVFHQNTATNYSAVAAAGDTSGTAVSLTSTVVKGYVAAPSSTTSPYAPLFSSGGSVKGFTSPATPSIDLSRISRSPYIPKFETLPGGAGGLAANWATTPKGTPLYLEYTMNIGAAGDTVPSRYYYNGNLTIGTATLNILRINGPVILYVNGDLFITASGSTGRIDIASTASAEIHVAGAFKADVGGEGILSYNSDPRSLIIISDTTSNATHFYSEGVNDLYGVIYIPYSTSSTGYYNDNNNTEIFGAVSANKITYSGANLNIHYDTSLRYATFGGVDQPYGITEWRELTDAIELATMP